MILMRRSALPAERGKLRALAGLGTELLVVVPEVAGQGEPVRFEQDGTMRIAPVRARGPAEMPDEYRCSARSLRRAVREFRPEVMQVEEELWHPATSAVLREAGRAAVPAVGFARQVWPQRLGFRESRRRTHALRRVAGILAASTLAAEALRASAPDTRVAAVPPAGVDIPPDPTPMHDGPLTVGFIGRLLHHRGPDLLLRAAARLAPDWRIVISGTGPAQVELETLAQHLGIAARVTWLGAQARADRSDLLQDLDLFVAPYREDENWRELAGMPVMAAMAHGIPVVASRSGILPELVDDAGELVPPDDVDALAAALAALQRDPERRRAAGATGRRRAQQEFSHDAVARRTLDVWRQVATAV